jgi:elongation factor Ts
LEISAAAVKELREKTGAGVMECRNALVKSEGNMEMAQSILKQKGAEKADKKKDRETNQGRIESYIHMGRIGVLLELNCETDFVAKTEEFQNLAKELAMQIAAQGPQYVSRDKIPQEVIDKEREAARKNVEENKKPEIIEKIIEGRLDKYLSKICLLEQGYIRDEDKKVGDIIKDVIAKTGENIVVNRFTRYVLGGEAE